MKNFIKLTKQFRDLYHLILQDKLFYLGVIYDKRRKLKLLTDLRKDDNSS
jgi:hypothetical protein